MTDILVVDGGSVYIFSTENQKWRTLPFSDSYTYNNNLINIGDRIFLFDSIKVKEFIEPTKNFHVIKSMINAYKKYVTCKLSSTEVAIVGGLVISIIVLVISIMLIWV